MDKIINNVKKPSGYINEITDSLNEFLCDEHKELIKRSGKSCGTYIQDSDNGYFAIRVPGATRGHIRVENNTITEIKFYEPAKRCYRDGYEETIKKYIGCKWTYCSGKIKNLFECKESMTQEERDREDFINGIIATIGAVIIGLIIFLIKH